MPRKNSQAIPLHAPRPTTIGSPETGVSVLSDAEVIAHGRALDETIHALGGKAGIIDTLSVASDVPEVEKLLRLCLDPRYDGVALKKLCTLAGLTVVDLFSAYKKAMIVKAHLLAYETITRRLPAIVEDVMKRAAPYEIPCNGCGGKGEIVDDEGGKSAALITCPTCNGHKVLVQLPDLDRQKVALELAQLVQKAAGINIQQNNVQVPPPDPEPTAGRGTLIELQHAIAELSRGPRRPILDAEVVAPTPTEIAEGP